MTLEAWVKPTAFGNWNTVVFKERPGYYAAVVCEHRHEQAVRERLHELGQRCAWRRPGCVEHLDTSRRHLRRRDLQLYVNGAQSATTAVSGAIVASTGALKIGGNSIWGEYFAGLIDEVRVYNKALTVAEVTTDMNGHRTCGPDSSPPSAPGF